MARRYDTAHYLRAVESIRARFPLAAITTDIMVGFPGETEADFFDSLDFARRYMHITQDEGWSWGLIRTGMSTASRLFVVQMQDVLELPAGCRMNTPGLSSGNWQWRMLPGSLRPELAEKLLEYTWTFRRTDVKPPRLVKKAEEKAAKAAAEAKAKEETPDKKQNK